MTSLSEELRGCLEAAGARLDAALSREEGYRALQQLEARQIEGRPVEVVPTAELRASLIRGLADARLYLRRRQIAEAEALLAASDLEPFIEAHVRGREAPALVRGEPAAPAPGPLPAARTATEAAVAQPGRPDSPPAGDQAAALATPPALPPAAPVAEAEAQAALAVAAAFLMAARPAGPAAAGPAEKPSSAHLASGPIAAPLGSPAGPGAATEPPAELGAPAVPRFTGASVAAVLEAAVLASIAKLKSNAAAPAGAEARPVEPPAGQTAPAAPAAGTAVETAPPAETASAGPAPSAGQTAPPAAEMARPLPASTVPPTPDTGLDGAIADVVAATVAAARSIRGEERAAPPPTAAQPAARPAPARDGLLPPGSPLETGEPAAARAAGPGLFAAPRAISEAELELAEVRIVPRSPPAPAPGPLRPALEPRRPAAAAGPSGRPAATAASQTPASPIPASQTPASQPVRWQQADLAEILPSDSYEATIEIRRPGEPPPTNGPDEPDALAAAGDGKLGRFMRTLTGAKT